MNNENKDIIFPEINLSLSFDKKVKKSELFRITTPKDAYHVFKSVFNADTFYWKEEMIMICMSRANQVLGFYKVSSGGLNVTIADPKVIFTVALNCGASSIIIAHNHPSGQLNPSTPDKKITEVIKNAGRILDIDLFDHMILGDDSYYSFAENGTL
jgi:DNA repair protein RadC